MKTGELPKILSASKTLFATTDASVWAREFMQINKDKLSEIDEGLMIGWFANAMVNAEDHVLRKLEEK